MSFPRRSIRHFVLHKLTSTSLPTLYHWHRQSWHPLLQEKLSGTCLHLRHAGYVSWICRPSPMKPLSRWTTQSETVSFHAAYVICSFVSLCHRYGTDHSVEPITVWRLVNTLEKSSKRNAGVLTTPLNSHPAYNPGQDACDAASSCVPPRLKSPQTFFPFALWEVTPTTSALL